MAMPTCACFTHLAHNPIHLPATACSWASLTVPCPLPCHVHLPTAMPSHAASLASPVGCGGRKGWEVTHAPHGDWSSWGLLAFYYYDFFVYFLYVGSAQEDFLLLFFFFFWMWILIFSPFLRHIFSFHYKHPSGCKVAFYCGFDVHFLNDEWYWASFYVLFDHLYIVGKIFV